MPQGRCWPQHGLAAWEAGTGPRGREGNRPWGPRLLGLAAWFCCELAASFATYCRKLLQMDQVAHGTLSRAYFILERCVLYFSLIILDFFLQFSLAQQIWTCSIVLYLFQTIGITLKFHASGYSVLFLLCFLPHFRINNKKKTYIIYDYFIYLVSLFV